MLWRAPEIDELVYTVFDPIKIEEVTWQCLCLMAITNYFTITYFYF